MNFIQRILVVTLTFYGGTGCVSSACASESLVLAREGQPQAIVVLPAKPTRAAESGAQILTDHLTQICGGHFETVNEQQLNLTLENGRFKANDTRLVKRNYILVGESKLAQQLGATSKGLGPGGILIKTYPNALVLLGSDNATPTDPDGTRYAVTLFLERELGCRFLWPGELGKVVPHRETIAIAPTDYRFTPRLRQRKIRSAEFSPRLGQGLERLGVSSAEYHRVHSQAMATRSRDAGWFGWHRLGGTLGLQSGHAFGHLWDKYGQQHPEWFALQPDGSRDQSRSPKRSRLCVSNEALIETIAREKINELNRTGLGSASIGPNDGGQTTFCTCAACEGLDPADGRQINLVDFAPGAKRRKIPHVSLTDRYIHFWNNIASRVAQVHPTARLTADAYSAYSAPPVSARLHPNLAIRFVGISYTDEKRRQQDRADWQGWSAATDSLYFRPNLLLAARREGTPVVYVHKLAQDFRYLVQHSLIGTDVDACCHNWATQGLNYYACAQLHWDPELNVDALIDDYCQAGFGSGAKQVKLYLLRLEQLTDQVAADQLPVTKPYTPQIVELLRGHLDRAAAATRGEAKASQRVAFLRAGLEYTETYTAFYRIEDRYNAAGGRELTPEFRREFTAALDRNWTVSRDIFQNDHLAVNVAYVAWGSWRYFGRFGWTGPSPEATRRFE